MNKKYLSFLIVIVVLILPVHSLFADHIPGQDSGIPPLRYVELNLDSLTNDLDQPCREIYDILDNRPIQIIEGQPGSGAGEVPVYDNDASRNLVILIRSLQRQAEYTELQDGDIQRTAEYMRLLCEKEYEEDHALQHAYAHLIGEFVEETQDFIYQGYNGNPAFLTSQEAYYLLVDIGVRRVFMQDIADSARLGDNAKRSIIETVADNLFPLKYPTNDVGLPAGYVPEIAPDDLAGDLADGFYDDVEIGDDLNVPGGYGALSTLTLNSEASLKTVVKEAMQELNLRITKQLSYEQEKLDWGRGFFSYEICDLGVVVRNQGELGNLADGRPAERINREDRRNCRIATPGSLIQDQTSFVFGTALRQMELNDEYEEWIAPNTLAVLNDILSFRGFNNLESRNPLNGANPEAGISTNPVPPYSQPGPGDTVLGDNYPNNLPGYNVNNINALDDITLESREPRNRSQYGDYANPNPTPNDLFQQGIDDGTVKWPVKEGPLPFEFSRQIDVELFGAESLGELGAAFFNNVLDPYQFLP